VAGPDLQGADLFALSGSGPVMMKDGTQFVQTTGSSCPIEGCYSEVFPDTGVANKITWTNNSVTDLVGRAVSVQTSGSGFSGSTKLSSNAVIAVQYPDSSGTLRTVTIEMQTMQFTCTNSQGIGSPGVPAEVGSGGYLNSNNQVVLSMGPYSMPTAIILPNGLTYTFQYDSCGMLRKVTYPTGGYTRYDYSAQEKLFGYDGGSTFTYYVNEISAKHVCPSPAMTLGATSASAWNSSDQCPVTEETTTYSPTVYAAVVNGNSNTQNIVVDPVGNETDLTP
jgi:hypothetical protein